MQNGYYQVTGAMVTQFHKLDVTSNNLANVNTQGFKRDDIVIGDFERLYKNKRDILELKNHTKEAAKFFNRTINRVPKVVENSIDFSMGSIRKTGNKLDFALSKRDTFYAVMTPNGVRLTQQSSFKLDNNGKIVTADGFALLPKDFLSTNKKDITIKQKGDLNISDDGTIYIGKNRVDTIFVGAVKNLKALKKEGDKFYTMPDLQNALNQVDGGGLMKQGYIQMSNINAVKEMTSLIETNRLVEMYQKVMTSHMDELNRDAITKLATTRA
ncbi:MAG: flagellar biosynthesis protein FlgG [Sulfurospirillum sp.]|nr:MAG: flagellar biosynthesis protein FlgG [Sulfurospirillum sp.]